MTRPRIAFVVQRAGVEVNGGADYLCLAVARAMSARWDVEIITTCARDYATWENHYPPGVERLDGVTIRRFPVDRPREQAHFDRLSARMLEHITDAPLAEQEAWMQAQGPYSTPLLRYLAEHRDDYERFFFYTYLYATTYFGLPLVAEKAVLVPFAHDEWPIRMPFFEAMFRLPAAIAFSTPEERDFLHTRFPDVRFDGPIVGIGVEAPPDVRPERFRRRYGIEGPFAVYVGRIDPEKGCERLIAAFAHYREHYRDDLNLVLVGRAAMELPRLPYVRAVGFVDEESKFDALAAADVVVMPSALESLSIVLLEAWSVGRPVLVSAAGDVLVGQTRRAGGGLWYADDAEFTVALHLLRGPDGPRLGASGRAFVEREYRWESIVAAYEQLLTKR